jgi:hypothetical protein
MRAEHASLKANVHRFAVLMVAFSVHTRILRSPTHNSCSSATGTIIVSSMMIFKELVSLSIRPLLVVHYGCAPFYVWLKFSDDNVMNSSLVWLLLLSAINIHLPPHCTGALVLGGILAGLKQTRRKLTESRIVCLGGGGAALGVCRAIIYGVLVLCLRYY